MNNDPSQFKYCKWSIKDYFYIYEIMGIAKDNPKLMMLKCIKSYCKDAVGVQAQYYYNELIDEHDRKMGDNVIFYKTYEEMVKDNFDLLLTI